MALTTAQLLTLKAATNGDSNLAAARAAGDQGAIAAYYNGAGAGLIWRPAISIAELNTAIVWSEFILLSQGQRDAYSALISGATIDATNANVRNGFGSIFGGTSITNLTAIAQRAPTRFEALFTTASVSSVFGYQVTVADIAQALGS
jgi:hypothetical protein